MNRVRHRIVGLVATALPFVAMAQQSGLQTLYEYDAMGHLTRSTDGAGAAQSTSYDALGRPVSQTDPLGMSTNLSYDGRDQITQVLTPNGAATTYQADGLGFVTIESGPDRGTVSYQRDVAGLPVTRTDARGAREEVSYDALNRPVERRFYSPGGTLERRYTLTWDSGANGVGRLGAIDTGDNTLLFGYDAYGHLTARTYIAGTVSLPTTWSYDAVRGRPNSMLYPSGAALSYAYDTAGRLTSMSWAGVVIAGSIEYEPFGPPSAWTLASGLDHIRVFDRAGRVDGFTAAGESVVLGYDAAGRLVDMNPVATPSRHQQFSYDAAGHLTGYVDPVNTLSYAYDGNGNRLSTHFNGTTDSYSYAALSNRLTSYGGHPYSYDAAGNILADDTRTFTYDAAGRLVTASRSFASASYQYDGLGERSRKTAGTLTRHYVYDTAGHLLGEYDATGNPVVEYAWLGDVPVALRRYVGGLPETLAIETDQLGTPRVITDSLQQVRWRWTSGPFGNSPPEENPSGAGTVVFNLRFSGQYYDDETGLHYNYFRDYDPVTGRYVESDPIGLAGGINTYGYVLGNPVSFIDAEGLATTAPVPGQDGAGRYFYGGGGGGFGGGGRATAGTPARTSPANLNPTQSRSEMSGSQVRRIEKDMRENGYRPNCPPIDVQRVPGSRRFDIIDGHHRAEAARRAGLPSVPIIILELAP